MAKQKLVDKIGQFTTVPNSVIRLWPEIGLDAFAVFTYLRFRSNEHDECFPAYDRICEETTLTRSRVSAALGILEERGIVTKTKRFGKSTIYTLHLPSSPPVELLDEENDAVVQLSDSSSPAVGLSVVQGVDTNQTHLTRFIEPDKEEEGAFAKIAGELEAILGGTLGMDTADVIDEWLKSYPQEWIFEAIEITKENRARSHKYTTKILERWREEGKMGRKNGRASQADRNKALLDEVFADGD